MRVLRLLSSILRGESSPELVRGGGVLVRFLASVLAPVWLLVDGPLAVSSRSSRSSLVDEALLGGCSGGMVPWMMPRILLYSGMSSSAIPGLFPCGSSGLSGSSVSSGSSGSSVDVVEKPWKELVPSDSSSAAPSESSELVIMSGGRLVLVFRIRSRACWMSGSSPLSGWFSRPLM